MTGLNIQLTAALILTLIGLGPAHAADRSYQSQSLGTAGPDWRGLAKDHGLLRSERKGPPVAPPVLIDPPKPAYDHRALPAQCLDKIETRYGRQAIYDTRCMSQFSNLVAQLPQGCRVRVVTWGATRDGYDAPCLRDRGYFTDH